MNMKAVAALVVVGLIGIIASQALFVVQQTEQAIVLQFGNPKKTILTPGLNVKTPFLQNVVYFDNRLLDLDAPPQEIIASDQERLVVDAFAKFQIVDPLQFYQKLRTIGGARLQLAGFLESNIRRVMGGVPSNEIVSGERANLMNLIEQGVNDQVQANEYGLVIRDVRIRRADLPESISERVFGRMRSERQQEASQIRAEGEEAARRIRAEAEKQATVILARARETSEITRGEGDALRNAIFACSFGADPDFFAFYRSMQAYEKSFNSDDTTMVLSPDSEFFRFFGDANGKSEVMAAAPQASSFAGSRDPKCRNGVYDLTGVEFLELDGSEVAPE